MPFADPAVSRSVSTGFRLHSDRFGSVDLRFRRHHTMRSGAVLRPLKAKIELLIFPVLSGISAVCPSISNTASLQVIAIHLTKSQIQIYRILLQRIPVTGSAGCREIFRHTIAIQIQLRRCLSFCPLRYIKYHTRIGQNVCSFDAGYPPR